MGYLDPGLFGILSQVGLTVFLLVVSAFAFFGKSIKKAFAKIFKGGKQEETKTETVSTPEDQLPR